MIHEDQKTKLKDDFSVWIQSIVKEFCRNFPDNSLKNEENEGARAKHMPILTRSVKISVAASLVSLFIYTSYIYRGSYAILFGYLTNAPGDVSYVTLIGSVFWVGFVGLTARFIGLLLGLTAVFLLWIKSWPFLRVKKLVIAALILEGVNFVGLIPSLWFLLSPRSIIFFPSLGYGYLLQVLFTVPFLWALAYQVAKYRESSQKPHLLKFGALAFVGYTVALVANEGSRWASMISAESLRFIEGIRAVGFFNALAFMPFSIVFAVAGAYRLFQQEEYPAMRWFGASLSVIGLNYAIYLAYSYFAHSLNTLPLVDVWTVPLLGLGMALLIKSRKKISTNRARAIS